MKELTELEKQELKRIYYDAIKEGVKEAFLQVLGTPSSLHYEIREAIESAVFSSMPYSETIVSAIYDAHVKRGK